MTTPAEQALAELRAAHDAAQRRVAQGQPGCFGRYVPLRLELARLERLGAGHAEGAAAFRAVAAAGQAEIDWLLLHQAARLGEPSGTR